MSSVLWAVIGCGVIAVLYGVYTASRVMAADAAIHDFPHGNKGVDTGCAGMTVDRRQRKTWMAGLRRP